MKDYVIGLDLGGTKISCALADILGNIIAEVNMKTLAQEGEGAVLSRMIEAIERVMKEGNIPS